jgi:hypothetical protein
MYVYNISGGVANIFYQSCAQIDNNQQVYEAQIQVPRCNSILKAGSHECQKLKLTTVYFILSDLIDTDIANCHIVSNAYWGHHDSLPHASSKHHCLHTLYIVCMHVHACI